MSELNIERAGGVGLADLSRRGVLERAPAWWRQLAARDAASSPAARPAKPAPAKPTARAQAPVIGWLAGTCCPGVSIPALATSDGRELPEQFTHAAWASMLRQANSQTNPVTLTWGHRGPTIATTRGLGLLFRIDRRVGELIGLEFEARLPDNELGRRVLAEAAEGLGVSIGYHSARQWIVERDGIGPVRVVDECVLHHVAVLPRAAKLAPCFPAARCYAATGKAMTCPAEIHSRARQAAYAVIRAQAGRPCDGA